MLLGQSLKETHRPRLASWRDEPLMHPCLPMVGVDFDQVQVLGREEVDVKPFSQVLDGRAGLRRAVVPLMTLLRRPATYRRQDVLAFLPAEGIHHFGHVTGVNPDR